MADTTRSLAALQTLLADNSSGDISAQDARDFLVSTYKPQAWPAGGRLTTESGVGVSTSDRTAQSTIYYTPFAHNAIGLYDGTSWTLFTFTERSLALSGLTSGKNYDVFLYDNAGTLTLELSAAWTNDTTRADALTTQDGVLVKSGATTRRYLGTIRTTGTTTTEDSAAKRFVWNWQNQVRRELYVIDATSSWTLGASSSWSQRGSKQVEAVIGQATHVCLDLNAICSAGGISGAGVCVGIGTDSTSATDSLAISPQHNVTTVVNIVAQLRKTHTLGYHFWAWLENAVAATATYFGGNTSPTRQYSGITGFVMG